MNTTLALENVPESNLAQIKQIMINLCINASHALV